MQRRVGPFSEQVVVPVRTRRAHRDGPTYGEARGARWRRSSHGFYVPADVERSPEQRVAEASVVLPEVAGITGWAALRWMGGRWFDGAGRAGEEPVPLATCYSDIRNQPGILVRQERLAPADLVEHDGLRLTSAARSLCFAMRYASSLTDAVVAADMAAYSDLLSLREAGEYTFSHTGITGIDQARRALRLASEASWSPMETRLRMAWVLDACLSRPLVNCPVFDEGGRHLATPDLLDPEVGLAIEYDGSLHLASAQRSRDLRRERAMRSAGLEYLCVVRQDFFNPDRLVELLTTARRSARAHRPRGWTTQRPLWWRPTDTVDQRRTGQAAGRSA